MTFTPSQAAHPIDLITERTMPVLPARLIVGAVAAGVTAFSIDPRVGLVWLAAAASAEAWTWRATRPQRQRQPLVLSERRIYIASLVWMNMVWCSLAIVVWRRGLDYRLAAVVLLAAQMLHAQTFTNRSWTVFAIVGGFPAATLLGLVGLDTQVSARAHVLDVVAATGMLTYMLRAAQVDARQRNGLDASRREAEAANAAKSHYLAMMSHELRTPLSGVLGVARSLGDAHLDEDHQRRVETMVGAGEAMLRMLNEMLDLSKAEAGKLELDEQPLDLQRKLDNVLSLWRSVGEAKGLTLTGALAPDVDRWQIGDPGRLTQILNNLVGNAVKFTERGEVRVAIALSGDRLRFTVSDTGIGLTADQAARLFQPYVQAESSTARRFGGTGLGLSICRTLVEAMGGTISATGRVGIGSTFTVHLPNRPTEPPAAIETRGVAATWLLKGRRILIVDDHPVNCTLVKLTLEPFEVEVITADGGAAALTVLEATEVDAILLDVHMPNLSGPETLRRIRTKGLVSTETPILALTGDVRPEQIALRLEDGFVAVLPKPFHPDQLLQALTDALADGEPGASVTG